MTPVLQLNNYLFLMIAVKTNEVFENIIFAKFNEGKKSNAASCVK